MPGATWFESEYDAQEAIDVLLDVLEDKQKFWDVLRARNLARQKRELEYMIMDDENIKKSIRS
jgi:hypothetical protein